MSATHLTVARAWLLLAVAGALETAWGVGLRATNGFTRRGPSLAVVALALLSFWLFGLAMQALPVGPATQRGSASAPPALSGSDWRTTEPLRAAGRMGR